MLSPSSSSFYRKAISGENSVEVVDNIIIKDSWRNREIPLKIYYPQAEGSYPLIIFSHGAGGSKDSFTYLSRFWASCGYICLHPTHLGSDLSVLQKIGLQALLEVTNDPEFYSERPQDISFIIDSLDEIEQQAELQGKINKAVIGVSGHSYGAYTTMLLAGAVIELPGGDEASFLDDRISVFLGISPQGTNRLGLNKHSWDKIKDPIMMVSGSKDQGWEGKPASWRLEAFNYMPKGDKYHVFIDGANHFSFDLQARIAKNIVSKSKLEKNTMRSKNLAEFDQNSRIKIYLKSASIAFWDAYLKLKSSGKEYLWSDTLKIDSNSEVELYLK